MIGTWFDARNVNLDGGEVARGCLRRAVEWRGDAGTPWVRSPSVGWCHTGWSRCRKGMICVVVLGASARVPVMHVEEKRMATESDPERSEALEVALSYYQASTSMTSTVR